METFEASKSLSTPFENGPVQKSIAPQGPSLKQRTVSGFKWLVANNVVKKIISIISFAVLARILEPSTFGLFAMAFIAIDGFSLFKSFGIDTALIQRKDTGETLERAKHTAFFIIQAIGVVIFLLFQIFAPVAAKLLNNPEVLTIMRALGFVFIFGCLGRIPGAMLTKEMRFRVIAIVEFVSSVVNSVFAVIFALITPTVWALVGAYLIKQITTASMNWYFERYHVKFVFDKKIARELLGYGKYMVGLSLLWYLASNFDNMVVARMMGPSSLGLFVLANNITYFTHSQFLTHIGTVMFPAFAKMQSEPEALKRAYLKNVRYVSMLITPYGVGLVLLAREVVMAVYGSKWLEVVPVIQMLCYVHLFTPIYACAGSVFMGCGRPKYIYYLQVTSLLIKLPASYFLVKQFGLMGAVYAGIAEMLFVGPVNYILAQKIIGFKFGEIMAQIIPSVICSLAMVGVILGLKTFFAHDQFLAQFTFHKRQILPLFIFGSVSGLAYAISFYFVDRNSFQEVKRMIFNKLEKA